MNAPSATSVPSRRRLVYLVGIALLLGSGYLVRFGTSSVAQPPGADELSGWSERIETALREGKGELALAEIDRALEKAPKQPQLYLMRGSLQFRTGKIEESLVDFDKCLELDPNLRPYLWQRGISLYYAGKYTEGIEQFTSHRDVNPNDVENAFWYFLCAAKRDGVEAAKKGVLLSGRDSRVPMNQVQELIQGKLEPAAVIEAAERGRQPTRGPDYNRFYGYLYVGLYYDAIGDREQAKEWLEKCVALKVNGYMGDVAKVHLDLLKQDLRKQQP